VNDELLRLRDTLAAMDDAQRQQAIEDLPDDAARLLAYDWQLWARDKQLRPDGDWLVWLILAGRGWGKTRTGAETVRLWAEEQPGIRIALVARTPADVRDTMVEGESGLLNISPPWFKPVWTPSTRRLTWPNGSTATTFSAETPNALRGPQHHKAWADEIATWKYPDTWDQLQFGLRLPGATPQVVVTTTPRPIPLVKELVARSTDGTGEVRVTGGSTYENRDNLSAQFVRQVVRRYEGTRLGRQELHAELLGDTPGALWHRAMLEAAAWAKLLPKFSRIVVACDPAVSNDPESGSAETGVVVAGLAKVPYDMAGKPLYDLLQPGQIIDPRGVSRWWDHVWILDDLSGHHSPDGWARVLVNTARAHKADRIVAEINNGGALVEANVRTVWANAPYLGLHASRGKRTRAEPISACYEQGRVHHVVRSALLEDQMCTWVPDSGEPSPDRMDALVWACTELLLPKDPPPPRGLVRSGDRRSRLKGWGV
jgi:phage terminase large subunit-like protein